MAVLLVIERSNPNGTTFILKFVRFCDKSSPNFKRYQINSLLIVAVPLATEKSNPTGIMFKFKLDCFWIS